MDSEAEAPNNAYGQVYYKQYNLDDAESNEAAKYAFALLKYDIADSGVDPTFSPDWLMIITWEKMRNLPFITQTNTFQLVMAQDSSSSKTYVLFLFDDLNWKFNSFARSQEVVSGVRGIAPNIRNAIRHTTFVGRRSAFYSLDIFSGNLPDKRAGRYFFKVSINPTDTCLVPITPESQCYAWTAKQRQWNFASITRRRQQLGLSRCPCSERTLKRSGMFRRWTAEGARQKSFIDSNFFERCYTSRRVRRGTEGIVCCYLRVGGTSILQPTKSVFVTFNPNIRRRFSDYTKFVEDDYPGYDYCCRKSGLCSEFLKHRAIGICIASRSRLSSSFGDPHITTIDERDYAFNGLGEYYLLTYGTKSNTEFEIQARTARALDKDNKKSFATVFTGVTTIDINSNIAVFIGLKDGTQNEIEVFVRAEKSNTWDDKTTNFANAGLNNEIETSSDFLTIEKGNSTSEITVIYSERSVKLTVSAALGQLSLSLSVDKSWEANGDKKTRGLYGVFDGNPANDFEKPDGTVLDNNAKESQIFSDFGELWKLNVRTSKMYYKAGQDANTFVDTTFRPIFIDEFSKEQVNRAVSTCGGRDKASCIYDFLVTGKDDVAAAARQASEAFAEENKANNNNPPNITVVGGLEVRANGLVFWQITKSVSTEIEVINKMT